MDVAMLAGQCAPTVAIETMAALVTLESRQNPFAIGINGGARLSRQPATKTEAVATARDLLRRSFSVDLGLAQINSANLERAGLTVESAFEPCANLRAAAVILCGCYDRYAPHLGEEQRALQSALSCYNTGDPRQGLRNGYVQGVYQAAAGAKTSLLGHALVVPVAPIAARETGAPKAATTLTFLPSAAKPEGASPPLLTRPAPKEPRP